MEFGEKLKVLRKSHNLTHEQLSRIAYADGKNFSQSAISAWERGRKASSLHYSSLIGDIFGVSVDWLLGRSDNPFNESVLFKLEPSSFPLTVHFYGKNVELKFLDFPKAYTNTYYRSQNYTFHVRANIVFLLHVITLEFLDLLSKNKVLFLDDFDSGLKKLVDFYLGMSSEDNTLKVNVKRLEQVLQTGMPIFTYKY